MSFDEEDVLIVHDHGGEKRIDYHINELYWEKRNAEVALLKAQEKRLADYAEQIETLREKLSPKA
jgi:hypothetical protein